MHFVVSISQYTLLSSSRNLLDRPKVTPAVSHLDCNRRGVIFLWLTLFHSTLFCFVLGTLEIINTMLNYGLDPDPVILRAEEINRTNIRMPNNNLCHNLFSYLFFHILRLCVCVLQECVTYVSLQCFQSSYI